MHILVSLGMPHSLASFAHLKVRLFVGGNVLIFGLSGLVNTQRGVVSSNLFCSLAGACMTPGSYDSMKSS
jgi:hypothetical protein